MARATTSLKATPDLEAGLGAPDIGNFIEGLTSCDKGKQLYCFNDVCLARAIWSDQQCETDRSRSILTSLNPLNVREASAWG